MSDYATLLDRVDGLSPLLGGEDRRHAERVVALCRELVQRPRSDGKLILDARDLDLKRELGRLTELLGRRATHALPAATLGRAALADLSGDQSALRATCLDCDAKLAMLGH